MALIPANSRLPSLPTETHAHVLSYCDDQTLGRACLVSFAFLELAGPLLYEHITITGFAQLESMFYNEERASSAPHLDRFLSLNQTHTFDFVGVPADLLRAQPGPDQVKHSKLFFPKRSSCSFPVEVDTLDVHLPNLRANPGGLEDDLSAMIVESVLSLFTPVNATLAAESVTNIDPMIVDMYDAPWTRLRSLSVDAIAWSGLFSSSDFFRSLPPGSLTLTYDFTQPTPSSDYLVDSFIDQLYFIDPNDGISELLSPDWPQVKETVLKVRSVEHQDHILDEIRIHWDGELEPTEKDRREAKIRFLVV